MEQQGNAEPVGTCHHIAKHLAFAANLQSVNHLTWDGGLVEFHRNLNGMDARAESSERKFDRGCGISRRTEFLRVAALAGLSEETWLQSGEAVLSPLELTLLRNGRKVTLERFREMAVQNLSQALMISTYCSLDDGSNSLELREV